jgi:hypothetical protein|tara:strand:- start:92 stop:208 length:117 start_codon:yes stop_codon:yes gene_type:complete
MFNILEEVEGRVKSIRLSTLIFKKKSPHGGGSFEIKYW